MELFFMYQSLTHVNSLVWIYSFQTMEYTTLQAQKTNYPIRGFPVLFLLHTPGNPHFI